MYVILVDSAERAFLSRDEVLNLSGTWLHGEAALEDEGELPRATSPRESHQWCELLLDRRHSEEESS
jgi:hypothetical protein